MSEVKNIFNIDEQYGEITLNIVPYQCPHCGQNYNTPSLNIAVFFYGVFFLVNRESGYLGHTCPNCIQTIIISGTRQEVELAKQILAIPLNNVVMTEGNRLRYHPSVNHSLKKIPGLQKYNFHTWRGQVSEHINDEVSLYVESNPSLHEEFYNSYIPVEEPPTGEILFVRFYHPEQISELVKIENKKKVVIFPRYIYSNSVIENSERYCWSNYLYLDYLNDRIEEQKEGKKYLEDLAASENISVEELKRQNPGIGIDWIVEDLLTRYKKDRIYNFSILSDFMNILLDDPLPLDLVQGFDRDFIGAWKSELPFKGKGVPEKHWPHEFNEQFYETTENEQERRVKRIHASFFKEETQQLLLTLSKRYIFEYIELAKKTYYSYGHLWQLKKKYLDQIYAFVITSKRPKKNKDVKQHLQIPQAEKKRVKEIEKLFPDVKIISEDPQINKNKIRIEEDTKYLKAYPDERVDFLILGEKGTGKELFAQAIHKASGREGQLVPVDCGTISENLFESEFFGIIKNTITGVPVDKKGFFEQAHKGTLFFDEIGNLSLNHQQKLLRVLETLEVRPVGADITRKGQVKKVDCICVFATNNNLEEMVEEGAFLDDVYDRFNENILNIPPLRERVQDIPLLADHFIKILDKNRKKNHKLSPISMNKNCQDLLMQYRWPSNVRELRNVFRKIMRIPSILEDRRNIEVEDLPKKVTGSFHKETINLHSHETKKKAQKRPRIHDNKFIAAYNNHDQNIKKIAEELSEYANRKVSRKSVRSRLKKLNLYQA